MRRGPRTCWSRSPRAARSIAACALGYIEEQLRDRFGTTQPRAVAAILQAAREPVTIAELRAGLDGIAPELVTGPGEQRLARQPAPRTDQSGRHPPRRHPLPAAGRPPGARASRCSTAARSRRRWPRSRACPARRRRRAGPGGAALYRRAPGARHDRGGGDHRADEPDRYPRDDRAGGLDPSRRPLFQPLDQRHRPRPARAPWRR